MNGSIEQSSGKQQATQLTLKIWHPKCWTLETTAATDAGMVAHSVYEYDNVVNTRLTAYGDRHEQIEALIAEINNSESTKRVERIEKYFPQPHTEAAGNTTEELLVKYNSDNSIYNAFLSRGFIPGQGIRIYDGYEYWTVAVTAQRSVIREQLNEIRHEMDAKINIQGISSSEKRITNSERKNRLSERQREIFELAQQMGYYTWPREISVTELAENLDITKPTVLEHLRKAETKLLAPVQDRYH